MSHPEKTQHKPAKSKRDRSNSTSSQRARIADYLMENICAKTNELRDILDIMHPAGRIRELKAKGWAIITIMVDTPTARGGKRQQANYVLIKAPKVRAV
jgi:hypothetical protein